MIDGENFCLRLNQFGSNIRTTWQELQIDKDFSDITLACNDGQIESHKIIVSHSSPILKNILKQTPNQNPVIYLRGVKYEYLEKLVNFMYQGEVNVAEEDLKNFLDVAEDLKIRGLSEGNRETFTQTEELPKNIDKVLPYDPNEDFHKMNVLPKQTHKNSMEPLSRKKRKIQQFIKLISTETDPTSIAASQDFENDIFGESNLQILEPAGNDEMSKLSEENHNTQNLVSDSNKTFSCSMCNKQYTERSNLRRHKASAHEGVSYPCDQCNSAPFTDAGYLRQHKDSAHEGVRYPCDQCNAAPFTYAVNLRQHKASAHEGVRYECDSCDYKATRKGILKRHAKRIHNI